MSFDEQKAREIADKLPGEIGLRARRMAVRALMLEGRQYGYEEAEREARRRDAAYSDDALEVWAAVIAALEPLVDAYTIEAYFLPLELVGIDGDFLELEGSPAPARWLMRRYSAFTSSLASA